MRSVGIEALYSRDDALSGTPVRFSRFDAFALVQPCRPRILHAIEHKRQLCFSASRSLRDVAAVSLDNRDVRG